MYTTLRKVNGQSFKSFKEFYELLAQDKSSVLLLENEHGYQIAIDRALAESEHDTLLKNYRIQKAHSAEIDQWSAAIKKKLTLTHKTVKSSNKNNPL